MLLVSLAVYALIGLMPGDPIDLMLRADPHLTAADVARLKALEGARPAAARALSRWLGRRSAATSATRACIPSRCATILLPRLGSSLLLTGTAFVLGLALAFPARHLGGGAGRERGRRVVATVSFAGISLPTFWLALVLILLFAVGLGWLPASGQPRPRRRPLAAARHLVLPVATLTLAEAGCSPAIVRAAVRETLAQPFIRTARAKGVGRRGSCCATRCARRCCRSRPSWRSMAGSCSRARW